MKEGDFIRLDYDAFVKETDQIVDTTHEEVAKENDIYDERVKYEPIAVIVGSGQVIKGLDEELKKSEVGEEKEVDIPAEEAFGERDPKLVEVMPMNKILSLPEFRKGDKYPVEGMELMINNRPGIISRIFAGRVRIDFNHRWAGKTIHYKFKITSEIDNKEEKLRAIIEADFRTPDEFQIDFKDDETVDITLPDMVKLDNSWAMAKFKLVSDLRSHLGLTTIRFIEEYVKKEEPPEEESEEEKSPEEEKEADTEDETSEEGSEEKSEEEESSVPEKEEEEPEESSEDEEKE